VAHNVIPGRARVDWEMRPVRQADAEFIRAELHLFCTEALLPQMQAIDPSSSIRTQVIGDVAGLEPMDQNAARDLVAALTGANGTETVPFSTEAGLFQTLGIDVVV
jgi:acetylornithine deacetylase